MKRTIPMFLAVVALACGGDERGAGTVEGPARPAEAVAAGQRAQDAARETLALQAGGERAAAPKQVLFGDLHVHTTYSIDAFFMSLPIVAGEGAHPPADACDFARYCSSLDFFALTDHSLALTPEHWAWEKESLRQCQARAGSEADPDMAVFAGFEWTQVGDTPENHWGHKNVIFPGLEDAELPARPINSLADDTVQAFQDGQVRVGGLRALQVLDPLGWREYADFRWYLDRLLGTPPCPQGVDTRALPPDCAENAPDPAALFDKLGQWDLGALVIPHGTTWGLYSPPQTRLDKQLSRAQDDPQVQTIVEIMSGHGNSEEYRPWRATLTDGDGEPFCPEPTPGFLPCCWRAGEIMRERCGDRSSEECEDLVVLARQYAAESGVAPRMVFPDTSPEDWLDCDQCRDCFKPSLNYRPGGSAQYALALSNFDEADEDGDPRRFRWSFIASSDNHSARPGTGYKQYERRKMTESTGARSAFYEWLLRRSRISTFAPDAQPDRPYKRQEQGVRLLNLLGADTERVGSFLFPGGLAAVHSEGRSREAVWDSLDRGEIYGTSGPRILLWFDLVNDAGEIVPMGSQVRMAEAPRFEVRAVGSFVQQEGCPEPSTRALSPERLEYLCRGQCYHPSDQRHPIVAIEVVRIRPQAEPGEPVEALIEDPWRRFACEPDPAGCVVRFEDPEFVTSARDAVYYVRVVQEETPAVNGASLRTRFDERGNAVSVAPCYGDSRTPLDDDCLAPIQERAWSSPIFVDQSRMAMSVAD